MQVAIFDPSNVKADHIEGHNPKVALQMYEGDNYASVHFDDAQAMLAFGQKIVSEAERLIGDAPSVCREVPAGCGEDAP